MDYHTARNQLDAEFFAHQEEESDDAQSVDTTLDHLEPPEVTRALQLPPPEIPEHADDVVHDIVYRKVLITVDSRFRDFQSPSSTHFFHTFPSPLKNIIRLRLMGIEYGFGAYPFSSSRGNTSFKVDFGSGPRLVQIPVGYYATVSDLVSVLNGACTAQKINLEFSQYAPSMRVKVTTTVTTPVTLSFSELSDSPTRLTLGTALGFYYPSYTINANKPARGERLPSTDIDTYFLLQLDGVQAATHLMGMDSLPMLCKIQLPATSWGATVYVDQTVSSTQEVNFPQPVTLRKWEFRLVDAWGNVVDNNDLPISMTLELTQVFHSGVAEAHRLDTIPASVAQ